MKPLFSFIVLMLITLKTVNAQKETVYSKSFETNKQTTMIINLDNASVKIEPSIDGKVHLDYNIEFDGYSKKGIKKELEGILVEANKYENHITLVANKLAAEIKTYTYSGKGSFFLEGDLYGFDKKKNKDSIVRKTTDSLLKEIVGLQFRRPLEYFNNKFKIKDENGKIKNFRKSGIKIIRSLFVVKIPPFVKLTVNGKASTLSFTEDIINELSISMKKGLINAKKIINPYNKVRIEGTTIKAEYLIGGDYVFNASLGSKIAMVKDVEINSEFSKIEIGKIHEGVKITDFNSTYYFYNWSDNFKRFDLFSEYSKIHYFNPKEDFGWKVIGHNTINYIGEHKIEMQPNRKGEKFNMMERKPKKEGLFAGSINFDIIHGIIYSYEEPFTSNKN